MPENTLILKVAVDQVETWLLFWTECLIEKLMSINSEEQRPGLVNHRLGCTLGHSSSTTVVAPTVLEMENGWSTKILFTLSFLINSIR